MYIGSVDEGVNCYIGNTAPNKSVIITGRSGEGKSCRENIIELDAAEKGDTIICIDTSQNHQEAYLLSSIKERYCNRVNRIDGVEMGLNLHLLEPISYDGKTESLFNVISSNVTLLGSGLSLGVRQQAALRTVIGEAIQIQKRLGCDETEALIMAFESDERDIKRQEVYQKLWTVLHSRVFRNGTKKILGGMVNIIDLKGLEPRAAELVSEIVVGYLWRMVFNIGIPKEWGRVTIVIDEFQHFKLGNASTIRTILREGRRFGLGVILSTQTLNIFPKDVVVMLMQSATHLIFKPTDAEIQEVAKSIDPKRVSYWRKVLEGLKIGECIAIGAKNVSGCEITRPLKLR
ncbi:MAG: ATP-binding protein [Lachnospiraceae bacterium]|nr:ATP-binding protein [Lachnospiraceae bacterium]